MTGFKDVVGRKDLVSYIQKAVYAESDFPCLHFKWRARIGKKDVCAVVCNDTSVRTGRSGTMQ